MNIWSLIIAAALFLLPSLLSGKSKAGKKAAPVAPMPEDDFPLEEEEPHFMGDDDESLFDDDKESADSDDLGQPVFSYETVDAVDSKDIVDEKVSPEGNGVSFKFDEIETMPVAVLDEDFDLRKAVIYQSIMQRVSA